MTLRVTLVQGGGVGVDQARAVQRILHAAGADIEWDEHLAGQAAVEKGLAALPDAMLDSVRRNGLALKTKLIVPPAEPTRNYNLQFRRQLGLFASVRPLKNLRGLPARFDGVDILVIRELTEDLYAAIEHQIVPGVVQSLKVVTVTACRRITRFAFDYARQYGRKKIHCVHKANILKLADGLFLDAFRAAAKDFPDIETKEIIVDNCCMQLVSKPHQFDVMVMGNLYGDLVSDLGAGLVGGISATAAINFADGVRVFESLHGGTREQLGENLANPLPLLLPAVDLLDTVGQKATATRIFDAMQTVLCEHKMLTRDLGGEATTSQVADAIIKALRPANA
jgi:isocitrate dehydrogenase (NAD+)